ncbi:hypothetical protein BD289DRAFT_423744 [Coniella lustricola]|uniref:Uncharacterized protein n=1 Tax=Coniella lustricola TaxID=2025994 RepID=A0A2T3AJI7_9PEZI|nr:hypothetical protein BD289DRAFT_423744 [Coniella lustricola]
MFSYRVAFVLCTAFSAALASSEVTSLGGDKKCSATTTITSLSINTTPLTCACGAETVCTGGATLTTGPLPTSTLLEGCTLEVVVGPANCNQACPTCVTPTPVAHREKPRADIGVDSCSTPTTTTTVSIPPMEPLCFCPLITACPTSWSVSTLVQPTSTVVSGCTEEVLHEECGCDETCVPPTDVISVVTPTITSFPGHEVCSPTATVTISSSFTAPCACPLFASCSAGSTTATAPLPTTTLIEGCTEEVVVGPGCGCLECVAESA